MFCFANTAFHVFSYVSFELFRSYYDALMVTRKLMLWCSVVQLKFQICEWIKVVISLLIQSYCSIKNYWSCIDKFSVLYSFLLAKERRLSTTKDQLYDAPLNFRSFFSGERWALYTGKYGSWRNFNVSCNGICILSMMSQYSCLKHRQMISFLLYSLNSPVHRPFWINFL